MKKGYQTIKKMLSLIMVLAMVLTMLPATVFAADAPATLYLTPNENWIKDGAWFAAYFFGNGEKWAAMTDEDADGVYEVEVPSGYPSVIFCRMNPASTSTSWDNKWNQTADLTVPTDGTDHYTVAEGAWDKGDGTWSTYAYAVTFDGSNVTSSGADKAVVGKDYAAALTAAEGYDLPETVTVTIGGAVYTGFTYTEGVLTIPADAVIGAIVITAVGVEQAKDTVLYLTPNENWKIDSARFAAYFFNDSGNTWVSMTDTDSDGVYEVTVPEGTWGNVIFCRMNPASEENSWNNKWNQTSDLMIPTDGTNHYTVAEGAWDKGDGTWSIFTPAEPDPEPEPEPEETVLYLTPNENWTKDGARFAAYFFGSGTDTWVSMTDADSDGVYEVTVPEGTWPNVIFCRMNPSAVENNWDNKWNQTSDLVIPTDGTNHYTVAEGAWDNGAGTWSVFTSTEPETADYYLVGYLNNADYNGEDYQFVDGKLVVTFTADSYVAVKNDSGDWYMTEAFCQDTTGTFAKGNQEKMFIPGNVEVTFTLVENTDGTLTLSYVAETGDEGGESETTTYTAIFHFANTLGWSPVNLYVWNDDGATLGGWPGTAITAKDENGYHLMSVTYESEDNKGLNYIFNNGSLQTVDLSLDASYFDETTNTAEVWVELDPAANSDGKFVLKQIKEEDLGILFAVSPRIDGTSVTFEYAGDANTTSVEVRGTVTGATWEQGIAMSKNDKGLWTVTIDDLAPGVYEYKFVVNGSEWTADPANGKTSADGNSTFTIVDPNAEDTNKITINVYYERADGIYEVTQTDGTVAQWNAYVWGDSMAGTRYDFTKDAEGKMVTTIEVVGRDTQYVSLKTRLSTKAKEWIQEESEVKVDLADIVSGTINVYIKSDGTGGNKGSLTTSVNTAVDIVTANKLTGLQLDYDTGKIAVTTLNPVTDPAAQLTIVNTQDADDDIAINSIATSGSTYTLTLSKQLDLVNLYKYQIVFEGYNYPIDISSVYASDKFAEEFTYEGDDLGAAYSAAGTTFKVWAPTAEAVNVKLYKSGTEGTDDCIGTHAMTKGEKGVWSATVQGGQNGVYYTYEVTRDGETIEAVDPYARTAGVNGNRGMIIDLDSTDPADGWSEITNKPASYTDAVIYELHVRDFSIDDSSGVKDEWQGKFLGLTQSGTKTANGATTGLDYLKDLGITHLHLLPIYDYASVDETTCSTFNWGYDPQNYNVPEGSYSTDPANGTARVAEMKEMVDTLHENNIGVVMDVVYNHVYNADTFCFNQIVPGYFSRVDSNRSGCGNDTASEREMVRKYIVESVLYWAKEYHIDGFRFDLVGLIDVETINQIVTEVHAYRPDIIFYGEGWDMDGTNKEPGTEMAKQGNASKTPGFAYFSDSMRNNIGGNNGNSTGFASGAGNGAAIAADWMANPWWTTNPQQVIQYASCHDNYTLVDKLILSTKASGVTSDIIKMNNLAAAFYMTSQGVPFIHAGEEFLREKLEEDGGRCENSYNASDYVNHLEWSNLEKDTYAANVEYYKGLIAFRKAHAALRYDTAAEVSSNVQSTQAGGNVVAFRIDGYGAGDDDIYVIFNANKAAKTVELPEGTWTIYINGEKSGTESLGTASGTVSVAGISALVLTKPDEGKDVNEATGEITLFFSNNKGWENVYAYAWTSAGEVLGTWPGTGMTFVETNEYGEEIYSIVVPASTEGIIFNNGNGEQTVDLVPGANGTGYYCTDKNGDGKWECGTYSRPVPMGGANEYFLHGYINGVDYAEGDYKFDENGKLTATFNSDSYVYVVNGNLSKTFMTDGYQGSVTSATMYDIAKHTLTQDKWDKLLVPGGTEVTFTLTVNEDDTVVLSYTLNIAGVEDTSGVQDGITLHCWNWSFSEIEKNMAAIAELGYTAIQTSPVQVMKEATNLTTNTVGSHWWVYYQPVDFVITTDSGNALGTKADLESMIETAHAYGIQVIVDVVANHLGNQTGNDLSDKIPEYLREDEYWHDIKTDISNWNDRYDMTQHCLTGLPDLNTANEDVQGYVLAFLKECIDIGVDGFRFDMAKSIETPEDDASFASDFWPTVVGGAEDYADETYGKDLYIYGEVLDNPAISVSAYTQYMAVTDNSWGNNLRNSVVSGTAALAEGYHKAANASNLVIWAESHDTFATDDASQSSAGVSEANINKTWALVAARADAMGLYLARPESMTQALGVASVTGWDNGEVKAANLFHNAFAGQSESIGNEHGISYVERGTSGVVLVNVNGNAAEISVTANAMADGTYTDQITGNVFTVADGKITGKIGDTGIAVVYNQTGYKITKGAGSTWTQGTNTGLEFTANGPYEKFTGVAVDGKLLSGTSYESKSGSTVVTLKTAYLDSLAVGEHTLTVQYVDGSASCTFSLKASQSSTETTAPETSEPETSVPETTAPETSEPETSVPETTEPETTAPGTTAPETTVPGTTAPEAGTPPTGDNSGIWFWSMMVLLSAAAAAALISLKRRFAEEE